MQQMQQYKSQQKRRMPQMQQNKQQQKQHMQPFRKCEGKFYLVVKKGRKMRKL